MLRILHLITTLELAGAQSLVLDLAERFDRDRFQTFVGFLHLEPVALQGRDPSRLQLVDFRRNGRFDPWSPLTVARWMSQNGIDLIHTHLVHAGVVGKLAARISGVRPIVSTRHYGEDSKESSWAYRAEDILSARGDGLIAVSHAVADHMDAVGIASRDRIEVIPNGIDTSFFRPEDPRSEIIEGSTDRLTIGSVGRLHPQKGFDILLEAFGAVDNSEIHLEIVGSGPEDAALEARANELGIGSRVSFLGPLDRNELRNRLRTWDLFALASQWEAFGIAILEAMAAGLPVVISDVEGTRELVEDGCSGRLIPPRDVRGFSEALAHLCNDKDARHRMGSIARERSNQFSIEATTRAHEALYERLTRR